MRKLNEWSPSPAISKGSTRLGECLLKFHLKIVMDKSKQED